MKSVGGRRSILIEVGGLDESLGATEDRNLWMRLAQRTDLADNPDALVARHEHLGIQLSRNCQVLAGDAAVLDRKWGPVVQGSCGRLAYQGWQAELITNAELCRAMRAAAAGRRGEAARAAWRGCSPGLARAWPGRWP